jgi:hypothetical protein
MEREMSAMNRGEESGGTEVNVTGQEPPGKSGLGLAAPPVVPAKLHGLSP